MVVKEALDTNGLARYPWLKTEKAAGMKSRGAEFVIVAVTLSLQDEALCSERETAKRDYIPVEQEERLAW